MHGTVGQATDQWDNFVITEEDYVEFLSRMTTNSAVPALFYPYFRERSFLFLGYSLRDWNMRAILRLLRTDWDREQWWAVLDEPDPLDVKSWERRNVTFYAMTLEEYLTGLRSFFDQWLEST